MGMDTDSQVWEYCEPLFSKHEQYDDSQECCRDFPSVGHCISTLAPILRGRQATDQICCRRAGQDSPEHM